MKFDDNKIQQVWEKGSPVENNDQAIWRKDQCGAWMKRSSHGDRSTQYGWEIDHIKPESEGRTDEISNLRPLQWSNNAEKQAGKLTCPVTANGTQNVRK